MPRADAPSLFGRTSALATLRSAAAGAAAGRGSLVLVAGEAGIGKTALLTDVYQFADADNALVLWGQCWDGEGAPAYWPWVQVLRGAIAAGVDPGDARSLLPEHTSSATIGDVSARFGMFDAVASMLAALAASRPVLVVLDDLHWADDDSLLLLDFCARHSGARPILLLGGYRDDEAPPRLQELASHHQQIGLTGLGQTDVAELMAAVTGERPPPPAARDVWHRTGGNPFLVLELTRLLGAQGVRPAGPSPRQVLNRVRDIVERRLARLSQPCIDLLTLAAVFGQEFRADMLEALTDHSIDAGDLLDEAVKARVLVETSPAGAHRFSHDLFRETIVDALPTPTRRRLHLAVACALEAMRTSGALVPPAQLAAHFAAGGASEKDVHYSGLAADDAAGRLAFEEAAEWCERAVDAFERGTSLDPATRLELVLRLADARNRAGHTELALDAYRRAADLARAISDGDALARVAIGVHGLGWRHRHAESIALLDEAAGFQATASGLRPRVLACLARSLHHSVVEQDWDRSERLAEDAVTAARSLDDPETVAFCLLAQHDARWRPGTAGARLPIAEEMLAAARAAGEKELEAQARLLRATALIELGEPSGVLELGTACDLYEELGHPRARYTALSRRATLALLAGRIADAHDLALQASALGELIGEPDTAGVRETLLWSVGRLAGRLVHEPIVPGPVDDPWPGLPILAAAFHAARGEVDAARHLLAQLDAADLPRVHDLETLSFVADAVAAAGQRQQQERLYELLSTYAGVHIVVGGCATYSGTVDHHLGALAQSLGRPDAARRHFDEAAHLHERLGVPAWQALSEAAGASVIADDKPRGTFRRDGTVWTIGLGGRQAHLPHAKGLGDLAILLARPGVAIHAGELHAGHRPETGSDPVLDGTAKAAFRRRLAELDVEIDKAAANHDIHGADTAQHEREALIAELASAVGLGGRDRRLGDTNERARKAVTARIRYAINRIDRSAPELGQHLAQSIQTGTWCVYQPIDPVAWDL